MFTETQNTDAKARLVLPMTFANATVVVEQVSESELRVRRAKPCPEDELPFEEESGIILTDSERDHFLELLANPPVPSAGLREAAARHKIRHG